jgi:DNA polymerase III epsilon subunit-like protein
MSYLSAALVLLLFACFVYVLAIRSERSGLRARLSEALDSYQALSQRLDGFKQKVEAHSIAATEARRQRDDLAVQLSKLSNDREITRARIREQEVQISRLEESLSRGASERNDLEARNRELEQRLKCLADRRAENVDKHGLGDYSMFSGSQSSAPRQLISNDLEKKSQIKSVSAFARPGRPDFVVLDLETTGFSAVDEIVEVALIHVSPEWREVSRLETTIQALKVSGAEALKIHGLDSTMLIESPLFADVAHGLADFIDDKILVSHNLAFDRRFLLRSFARVSGLSVDLGSGVDTLSGVAKAGTRKLEDLCRVHGIQVNRSHSAMGDAEALLKLINGGHIVPRITGQEAPVKARGLLRPGDSEFRPRCLIRESSPLATEPRLPKDLVSSPGFYQAPKGFRLGPMLALNPGDKVCCSCLKQRSRLREALYKKHADLGLMSARSLSEAHVCIVVEDFTSKADKVKDALARGIPLIAAADFLACRVGSLLQSWLPENPPIS